MLLAMTTDLLLTTIEINSVKYLTHSVCLNHWLNKKYTPHELSRIAKT